MKIQNRNQFLVQLGTTLLLGSIYPLLADNIYDDINTLYLRHKVINPKSCEAEYYGLFTDGTSGLTQFTDDGVNLHYKNWRQAYENTPEEQLSNLSKRWEKLKQIFSAVRQIYSKNLMNRKMFSDSGPLKDEWLRRVRLSDLHLMPPEFGNGEGAFMDLNNGLELSKKPDSLARLYRVRAFFA